MYGTDYMLFGFSGVVPSFATLSRSRLPDSNWGPSLYKRVALPTELRRLIFLCWCARRNVSIIFSYVPQPHAKTPILRRFPVESEWSCGAKAPSPTQAHALGQGYCAQPHGAELSFLTQRLCRRSLKVLWEDPAPPTLAPGGKRRRSPAAPLPKPLCRSSFQSA